MLLELRENDATLLIARRLVRLLLPAALAVMLFGLLAWPGLAFDFTKFRLSTFMPYKAFNPDMAAAGDYVAAVWSEGYNTDSATKHYGRVYLKSADAASGWEARIEVFPATDALWGRDPHVVFDPKDSSNSTVHVVWAQASECDEVCEWLTVRRTTCHLAGADTCDSPTTVVVYPPPVGDEPMTFVSGLDLAVDHLGNAHVIWVEVPENEPDKPGPIMYCKNSCGSSPRSTGYTGQHPALAFSEEDVDRYLHLVWDTGSDAASNIKYARDALPGNDTWDGGSDETWWNRSHPSYQEPSYPAVGSSGSAVYVIWAVQNKADPTKYALAFDFSSNGGADWVDYDPLDPTYHFGRSIPENERADFTSTWRAASEPANELYSLQPDVVVTGTGTSAYAHLVWHGKEYSASKYNIWYSYLAGYDEAGSWQPPETIDNWLVPTAIDVSAILNRGLPAIALGATPGERHVAFVEDASASYFGSINVWYVGTNGSRDNDGNLREGVISLPIIVKNSQ